MLHIWVGERNEKHKVRTCHVTQGRWRPGSQRIGLCENTHSYFYGQFQAKRCRDSLGCRVLLQALWASWEGQDSYAAPTQLRPMLTSASCQAIQVLWLSGGGAELKGCSHYNDHVVLEWTLISLPNHNPVWFCFVVFFQYTTGSRH